MENFTSIFTCQSEGSESLQIRSWNYEHNYEKPSPVSSNVDNSPWSHGGLVRWGFNLQMGFFSTQGLSGEASTLRYSEYSYLVDF